MFVTLKNTIILLQPVLKFRILVDSACLLEQSEEKPTPKLVPKISYFKNCYIPCFQGMPPIKAELLVSVIVKQPIIVLVQSKTTFYL